MSVINCCFYFICFSKVFVDTHIVVGNTRVAPMKCDVVNSKANVSARRGHGRDATVIVLFGLLDLFLEALDFVHQLGLTFLVVVAIAKLLCGVRP